MLKRIYRELVLLCLLANAIIVCGSPRTYTNDRQDRNRRYASCPSCSRDCPGALASPGYVHPTRTEYRGPEPKTSNWHSNQPLQANPSIYTSPYGSYDRASRSRGTPTINRSGDTRERQNPFNFQGDLDFDVAPAPSAPVHSVGSSINFHKEFDSYSDPASSAPVHSAGSSINFHKEFDSYSNPASSSRVHNVGSTINFHRELDSYSDPASSAPVHNVGSTINFHRELDSYSDPASSASAYNVGRAINFNRDLDSNTDPASSASAYNVGRPINFNRDLDSNTDPASSIPTVGSVGGPINFHRDLQPVVAPISSVPSYAVGRSAKFYKDLDSAVAPASSAPFHAVRNPINPYQSRLPVTKSSDETSHQKPSLYGMMKRQSELAVPSVYSGYDASDDEVPFQGIRASPHVYEDSRKKVNVVYRADKYTDDSHEERNINLQPKHYPSRRISDERSIPAVIERADRFPQPRRSQPQDSTVSRAPEVKRSSHDVSPDVNVLKMIQKAGREGIEVLRDNVWQEQFGERKPQKFQKNSFRVVKNDDQQQDKIVKQVNNNEQRDVVHDSRKDELQPLMGTGDATSEVNTEKSNESTLMKDSPRLEVSTETHLMRINKITEPEPVEAITQTPVTAS